MLWKKVPERVKEGTRDVVFEPVKECLADALKGGPVPSYCKDESK
jgi:hypothetical protein